MHYAMSEAKKSASEIHVGREFNDSTSEAAETETGFCCGSKLFLGGFLVEPLESSSMTLFFCVARCNSCELQR